MFNSPCPHQASMANPIPDVPTRINVFDTKKIVLIKNVKIVVLDQTNYFSWHMCNSLYCYSPLSSSCLEHDNYYGSLACTYLDGDLP